MPILHVTTLAGEIKEFDIAPGTVLMEPLNDAGLVDATCGGAASCGTCHVHFPSKEAAGEQTEDEGYMLEALADFVDVTDGSRLACQVKVTDAHDGVAITIIPDA
ncbi:MAG: 2Fe-2S iron-sulfur cluster-binding protein [Maricaulaceae bacterium]